MRRELVVKTRTLGGASDLTLLAPIRPGLVPSLETVTYKTRVKRLLEALNAGRTSSHEYALWRPFSDAVERVGKIHSVRVAVLEPEDKVLLAATFDGPWESYIRVLWQKVGTLLDVIFCNTEDYVSAYGHSFEEWKVWANRVQVETAFFYSMPGLTVDDVDYLRQSVERPLPSAPAPGPAAAPAALAAVRAKVRSVEEIAQHNVKARGAATIKEMGRQGLLALSAIHRLTSLYVPGQEDGDFLRRAAQDLLLEFMQLARTGTLDPVLGEGRRRFDEQLAWLFSPTPARSVPGTPTQGPVYDRADVQGGIVNAYENVTHGCLLLMAFSSPAAAATFLQTVHPLVTRDSSVLRSGDVMMNVALTCEGLRAIGLSEGQLDCFPQEFQEGMAARAGVLGDVRTNHPRRWRLPERNWPPAANPSMQKVELAAVHAVVQLRIHKPGNDVYALSDSEHPLYPVVANLLSDLPGVDLLSVEPMIRHLNDGRKPQEHFGFADGEGQPVVDPAKAPAPYGRNAVQLGELLLGYANEADPAPAAGSADDRHRLLHNGSFLVVRKLHQDVAAFAGAVEEKAAQGTGLHAERIYAKMMGRYRDGTPLVPSISGLNNFDYVDDPQGSLCPLHAHIRRANPRSRDDPETTPPGGRMPRITRRGMSYGPRYRTGPADAERGLMFMAYNASISEQFEVVQRWLSGANSSGGYSGQSDPLLGVPENGKQRFFQFEDEQTGQVHRIGLDGTTVPLGDPRPFVRLEWGCYLFTPSVKALQRLFEIAREADASRPAPLWSVTAGQEDIEMLQRLEQQQGTERAAEVWKTLLEEPQAQKDYRSASIWAAIRARHGGVLRTPYGVIVASHARVMEVLSNAAAHYSVSGYHQRMAASIGEIFLGLDDQGVHTCPYHKQADPTVEAIGKLTRQEGFALARGATKAVIKAFVDGEKGIAQATGEARWELQIAVKEVVDLVLQKVCEAWFGLNPDDKELELKGGGTRWDWKEGSKPLYPGNFTAPSRYFFQPQPGEVVEQYGRLYGRTLTEAFGRWVKRLRDADNEPLAAPIAGPIFKAFPSRLEDDLVARTIVGALMGLLPTVDGNLKLSLNEWLRDGTFWSLRAALAGADPAGRTQYQLATALLEPVLIKTMQLRPSPELIWRTSKTQHAIGPVEIWPEDKIVVALVSAAHESLERGDNDTYPIFGGNRSKLPHPTHACPGYEAAMGLLLGMLSGMLQFEEAMRPSPAALALTLEGDAGERPATSRAARIAAPPPSPPRPQPPADPRPLLLAEGDSWFDYRPATQSGDELNILQLLRDQHGFRTISLAEAGHTLKSIATQQLDLLCDRFNDLVARNTPPQAILLSAGGNDVTYDKLEPLLKKHGTNGKLDMVAVYQRVDIEMRGQLVAIFSRLARDCRYRGHPVPVFYHGYAHPVPDGRNAFGVPATKTSWLGRGLEKLKYTDLNDGIDIMQQLIDRLNTMQADVARDPAFSRHVFHVDLRGELSNDPTDDKYKQFWANELHPTELGFRKITQKLAYEIGLKLELAAQTGP